MLGVLVLCAAASGIVNDTPIVVLMMPVLVGAALRAKSSPARTLLPMNYAVLIGGMGTTIGTSTNLIVVAIAADLGVRRFEMFDFIHVTALAAIGGILYLWLVLPRGVPRVVCSAKTRSLCRVVSPRSTGRKLRPSRPAGTSTPAAASSVGITSTYSTMASLTEVGATAPGQRTMHALRMPAS